MLPAILLTRLNVLTGYSTGEVRLSDAWLERRISLFERYCAPSIVNQTGREFEWMIFLDAASPSWVSDRLSSAAPSASLIPVDGIFDGERAAECIRDRAAEPSTMLTMRLDCDDAVSSRFVHTVSEAAEDCIPGQWLQVRSGYQYANGTFLRTEWDSNPFIARVEDFSSTGARTALGENHSTVRRSFPLRDIDTDEFWVQTIHGLNTSPASRPRGYLARNKSGLYSRLHWSSMRDGNSDDTRLSARSVGIAAARESARRLVSRARAIKRSLHGTSGGSR